MCQERAIESKDIQFRNVGYCAVSIVDPPSDHMQKLAEAMIAPIRKRLGIIKKESRPPETDKTKH